jgi:hypothetical protein
VDHSEQLGSTIRDLCGLVLIAEGAEFDRLVAHLRQALRDFIESRTLPVRSYPATATSPRND